MRWDSIRQLREEGTAEDFAELADFIKSCTHRTSSFPCEKYHFSYAAASRELRSRGMLPPMRGHKAPGEEKKKPAKKRLEISGEPYSGQWVTRSFVIRRDLLDRLDELARDRWMYSKKAIVQEVLAAGLDAFS